MQTYTHVISTEKSSVCLSAFFPRQAVNSALSALIKAKLARNESYVLQHLQVYF